MTRHYEINKQNDGFYFPRLDRWIMDTFKLKLVEAIVYNLILIKGYIVWDYSYIAKVLALSTKSVCRIVQRLRDLGIIEVRTKLYDGNKRRNVLVCLYTNKGLRDRGQIETLFERGFEKLDSYYTD